MIVQEQIESQLNHTLAGTDFDFLGEKYEGKVRDNYTKDGKRVLITTDKLSAFDRIITKIPFKGQVLNQTTQFWFENTKDIIGSHYIDSPDPNVVVGVECETLPVEMIVRGYITGSTGTSLWYNYAQGERHIYGLDFPEGLVKNQQLPEPIITPTTKAPKGEHDERITPAEIVEQGLLSQEDYDYIAKKSVELYKFGVEHCAKQGVILVDTKYEFGRTPDGEIVVIDEIHTPDSSRFWITETYDEKFKAGEEPDNINKEYLRLWLANQGYMGDGEMPEITREVRIETAMKYIEAYEMITGEEFQPVTGNTLERMESNLKNYFD
jgi:phosphoribosylaminoimidazole-succinocarboxamide synthase